MSTNKNPGRPSLMTEERIRRIVASISAGNDVETAAAAAGISRATFHAWASRGRVEQARLEANPKSKVKASEKPFLDFLDSIETARARAEERYVLRISQAAEDPKTWQAAAWMLTHGPAKNKWKALNATEITGANGGPVQSETKQVQYSEAEIIALADEILGLKEQSDNREPVDE